MNDTTPPSPSDKLSMDEGIAYMLQAYDDLTFVPGAAPIRGYLRAAFRYVGYGFTTAHGRGIMREPFPIAPTTLVGPPMGATVTPHKLSGSNPLDMSDAKTMFSAQAIKWSIAWRHRFGAPAHMESAVSARNALNLLKKLGPQVKNAGVHARALYVRAQMLLGAAARRIKLRLGPGIREDFAKAKAGATRLAKGIVLPAVAVAATATGAAAGAAGARAGSSAGPIMAVGAVMAALWWASQYMPKGRR